MGNDDSMGKSTDSSGWKDFSKEKSGWQDWNKSGSSGSGSGWQDWNKDKEKPQNNIKATMEAMMKHVQDGTTPDLSSLTTEMQKQFAVGQMIFAQAAASGGVDPMQMMKDMIESGKIPGLGGKEGKGGGKRRKSGDDDDGKGGGKGNGPTSDDPNFRPEKSEEVPGITDQRWEG